MKIDVEGLEYEVLMGNDWKAYRPELICIEANNIVKNWRPHLKSVGYRKFFNDGLNDYYAEEHSEFLQTFSYPEKVLMRYPKIDYYTANADKTIIAHNTFTENKIDVEVEPVPFKLQLNWSLIGLHAALSRGIVAAILRQKRLLLSRRITADVASGRTYLHLKEPYYSPKLLMLRVVGLSFSAAFKIIRKARG